MTAAAVGSDGHSTARLLRRTLIASRSSTCSIRRILHLARRVGQIRTLLLLRASRSSRRASSSTLIGERALLRAAVAAAALLSLQRAAPLPLGFLLLAARELLQLLEQLVDLAIAACSCDCWLAVS